jgi:hypothetical protein
MWERDKMWEQSQLAKTKPGFQEETGALFDETRRGSRGTRYVKWRKGLHMSLPIFPEWVKRRRLCKAIRQGSNEVREFTIDFVPGSPKLSAGQGSIYRKRLHLAVDALTTRKSDCNGGVRCAVSIRSRIFLANLLFVVVAWRWMLVPRWHYCFCCIEACEATPFINRAIFRNWTTPAPAGLTATRYEL